MTYAKLKSQELSINYVMDYYQLTLIISHL
jgi:hypothetical protein